MNKTKTAPTLAEVDARVKEWRDRLQAAEASLEHARGQVGALALAGDVTQGQKLAAFETDVEVARAALAAAVAQRPEAERQRRQARIAQLEETYRDIQARLDDEIEPRVVELQSELAPLRAEMETLVRRQFALEHQIQRLRATVQTEVLQ